MFGVLALRLARIYKFIGLGLVGLTMICLVLWIDYRLRQRGVPLKPGGPQTPSESGENTISEMRAGEVKSVITTSIPGAQSQYM